jgi:hypothetical protein
VVVGAFAAVVPLVELLELLELLEHARAGPTRALQLRKGEDDVVRVELVEKVLSALWRLVAP